MPSRVENYSENDDSTYQLGILASQGLIAACIVSIVSSYSVKEGCDWRTDQATSVTTANNLLTRFSESTSSLQ